MRVTETLSGENCGSGINCPAIHATDQPDTVVVGNNITDPELRAQLNLADPEGALTFPRSLLDGVPRR